VPCPSGQTCSGGVCTGEEVSVEKILNVPLYTQTDSDYANHEFYVLHPETNERTPAYVNYGSGRECAAASTIKNSGCYPTSVGMVLAYYGKGRGVVGIINAFTDHGCHRVYGNCADANRPYNSLGGSVPCGSIYNEINLSSTFFDVDTMPDIARYIAMGYPVIVGVSPYGNVPTHGMVVKGYKKDSQGNITLYVNDPWAGNWKTISDPSIIYFAEYIAD